jgi:hypothetical protein
MYYDLNFENELKGKTLVNIEIEKNIDEDDAELVMKTSLGETYRLNHYAAGNERVFIEDICGDLSDLIGEPLLEAKEVTSFENPEDAKPGTIVNQYSFMWTFYKIGTCKGFVTIRWYGMDNGNYSLQVDLSKDA